MVDSFGTDNGDAINHLHPEPYDGAALSDEELRELLLAYRALDRATDGRYRKFLASNAGCSRCANDPTIPQSKMPVPGLSGVWDFDRPVDDLVHDLRHAASALSQYRRPADDANHRTLRFFPEDQAAREQLAAFLRREGLSGLFIGRCGWSDLTMRLRGPTASRGVRLMIFGNDWYPLTQCRDFLTDRCGVDHVVGNFVRWTRRATGTSGPEVAKENDVQAFFQEHDAYIANALGCFRTGWRTTGSSNLSRRSFENCRDLVREHVLALRPRALITFGQNSCATVASLLESDDPKVRDVIAALRLVNRSSPGLKAVMGGYMKMLSRPAGLRARCGDLGLSFLPICHPALPNRYAGDYEAVANMITDVVDGDLRP